ncbi:MAG: type II toxin-antitoxin system VapC family toxin [Deltaproteobacteria bacterium]|nr:type II toxin-antitoxin system VapC family toxin [Deltaproteobacteria bacterium]
MKLAVDTNAYRAFTEGQAGAVRWVRNADVLGISVPVLAELRFGFLAGSKGRQNEAGLLRFLDSPRVRILECDEQTSHFYSQLKLQLKTQGTPIPINDVWIAALALQHGMTLLTYDRDFNHVPQLPKAN